MRNILVRQANPQDVSDIQFVARQSWSEVYEGIIPANIQQQALDAWYSSAALLHAVGSRASVFLVAESAGKVLGFAHLVVRANGIAELARIYVLPDFQRRGVGGQLLADLLGQARELGVVDVTVTVEQRNRKGRAFYERAGFRASTESTADICGFAVPVVTYQHHVPERAA